MEIDKQELTTFVNTALNNCYLGEMKQAEVTEREGFYEMTYQDGDWSYRDSFVGFYTSTGQEIVKFKNKPIWYRNYGGGVIDEYIGNEEVFAKIEKFLRMVLGADLDPTEFRPRGPKEYIEGELRYQCDWSGDISNYSAEEHIYIGEEKVFTHKVFGGMIVGK